MGTSIKETSNSTREGTIIFLHGLADNSERWENELQKLFSSNEEQQQTDIKIFCPRSPQMPITRFGGRSMNAWFNVYDPYTSDEQGICNAARFVHNLIDLEVISGTSLNKIILSGHSQGGALALYAGLTYTPKDKEPAPNTLKSCSNNSNLRLGAVVSFGAWLPMLNQFQRYHNGEYSHGEVKKKTGPIQILQVHGELDNIVPYNWAKLSQNTIEHYCDEHELKSYKGAGHYVSDPQLFDFKMFCLSLLGMA